MVKLTAIYLVSLVTVLAIIFGIIAGIWGLRIATAGLIGKGEAHIRTQSATFRLQAYEGFFDQCSSIQGLEGQIDELTGQLLMLKSGTRSYEYTLSALTGTKGLRRAAIAKYNQDALKWTVGQFRDSDLPYQLLNSDYPSENGDTLCALE